MLWKMFHNILPSNYLHRRHQLISGVCAGGNKLETMEHTFFRCKMAKYIYIYIMYFVSPCHSEILFKWIGYPRFMVGCWALWEGKIWFFMGFPLLRWRDGLIGLWSRFEIFRYIRGGQWRVRCWVAERMGERLRLFGGVLLCNLLYQVECTTPSCTSMVGWHKGRGVGFQNLAGNM